MSTPPTGRRPGYGLDGPPILRNLLLAGLAGVAVGLTAHLLGVPRPGGVPVRGIGLIGGLNFLTVAAGLFWYSTVGKLRGRERFLDLIPWRGDERVLDVGCGRGLLVVGAARRLTTGSAVGVDLWLGRDLSGNGPEAARENARWEGVADRVDIRDGDARRLPFPDGSFDVVLSSLVLHNIHDPAERERAVRELARVLRTGGRLALVDVENTREYARVLRECGLSDVRRSAIGYATVLVMLATWGGARPYRVTAVKALVPVAERPTPAVAASAIMAAPAAV